MEPNFDWTAAVAERKIKEAIDAGEFDNLPGKGQPLDLETNPFEDPQMRAVNRLLKNAKALPPWLQLEKDIDREIGLLAETKERALRGLRHTSSAVGRERIAGRLRDQHRERMDLLNTLILHYDFIAPNLTRRIFPRFNLTREMAGLEAEISAS